MTDVQEFQEPTTPNYLKAKASLPEALHEEFKLVVQWYRYFAMTIHGSRMVSYVVLAGMVKEGFCMMTLSPQPTMADILKMLHEKGKAP